MMAGMLWATLGALGTCKLAAEPQKVTHLMKLGTLLVPFTRFLEPFLTKLDPKGIQKPYLFEHIMKKGDPKAKPEKT